MNPTAIALNRFGLGARPQDPLPDDPRAWLLDQLTGFDPAPAAWAALPGTARLLDDAAALRRARRSAGEAERLELQMRERQAARTAYRAAIDARLATALDSTTPFVERLVHFWANHFAVSVEKPAVMALAGAHEAEAIRPHVLGRFEDLLLAAVRHPAMLIYLDQDQSTGPASPAAARAARRQPGRVRGLNENLAREVLELHTVGVRSGYTQQDVTELARALTGWTVAGDAPSDAPAGLLSAPPAGVPAGFRFRADLHEPGPRAILGRGYPASGEDQASEILRTLARSPATARHVATRLARHFVADDPPAAVVDRLAAAFLRHRGDLPAVYRALVDAPEPWRAGGKFKTPWDWIVSLQRAVGSRGPGSGRRAVAPGDAARSEAGRGDAGERSHPAEGWLRQLGQPVWQPGSPAGWDDVAAAWVSPDGLMRQVELAGRLATRADRRLDARTLARRVLPGDALDAATAAAIAAADTPASGLALLLVSPAFLRR